MPTHISAEATGTTRPARRRERPATTATHSTLATAWRATVAAIQPRPGSGVASSWATTMPEARSVVAIPPRTLAAHGPDSAWAVEINGGSSERENLAVAKAILAGLGRPESLLRFVEDRPGHDRRYAIDASRARREIGWRPGRRFERGLRETLRWYEANQRWWRKIKSSGGFQAYFKAMYEKRIREGTPGGAA